MNKLMSILLNSLRVTSLFTLLLFEIAGASPTGLKVGDLLLVSYRPCRVCQVIESESNSKYSHLGVVLAIKGSSIRVADSLGSVRVSDYEEFTKNANIVDLYRINDLSRFRQDKLTELFEERYFTYFHGKPYDRAFLWDNVDENGDELLYCSEFIVKFLDPFLNFSFKLKPMSYIKNWDFWTNYMQPYTPPHGERGNNPQHLTEHKELVFIKNLFLKGGENE